MKTEKAEYILKTISNRRLPDLEAETLLQLPNPEHPISSLRVALGSSPEQYHKLTTEDGNLIPNNNTSQKVANQTDPKCFVTPNLSAKNWATKQTPREAHLPFTWNTPTMRITCTPITNVETPRTNMMKTLLSRETPNIPISETPSSSICEIMNKVCGLFPPGQTPNLSNIGNSPNVESKHQRRKNLMTRRIPQTPNTQKSLSYRLESSPCQFMIPRTPQMIVGTGVRTPFTSLQSPVTPLCFPCTSAYLSTPQLFPSKREKGVPDILQLIDSEGPAGQSLDIQLSTYETSNVTDDNVADFILGMYDSFKVPEPPAPKVAHTETLATQPLINGPRRKGRHSKRITIEMRTSLKTERKRKDAERRETRQRAKQRKTENKPWTLDENEIKRRVSKGGRRTRSLMRAAKQVGLGSTEEEITALFDKNCPSDEE